MPFDLQSLYAFRETLAEVDALLYLADANEGHETRYAALNKAAILLLTGKFESFAELLAAEFIYHINALQPRPAAIPLPIRIRHSAGVVAELERLMPHSHKREKAAAKFEELASLWGQSERFTNINVDCKFSYGAHGEAELRKLFANLGFDDIFSEVQMFEVRETIDATVAVPVDFAGIFNSITNLRNNILHHDATAELTMQDVMGFRNLFEQYAVLLADAILERLEVVRVACASADT